MHCLDEPSTESRTRLSFLEVRAARLDHGGPRNLWAEREPYLSARALHGRPHHTRFGLTITRDGSHTLWLEAPQKVSWPLP